MLQSRVEYIVIMFDPLVMFVANYRARRFLANYNRTISANELTERIPAHNTVRK